MQHNVIYDLLKQKKILKNVTYPVLPKNGRVISHVSYDIIVLKWIDVKAVDFNEMRASSNVSERKFSRAEYSSFRRVVTTCNLIWS